MMRQFGFLLLFFFAIGIAACESDNEETAQIKSESPAQAGDTSTLSYQLDKKKATWVASADVEQKRVFEEGIDQVRQSGVVEQALHEGDNAPDFTLSNATGKRVSLSDYLSRGPVVLTWYRGGWCPYCNITLRHLQAKLKDFEAAGATLIALTPELPDNSLSTKAKNELEFEILSDINNEVARKYGVVFKLNPDVAADYSERFSLAEYNGNNSNELPLAATYVIGTNGVIQYAFVDADYRKRAEPDKILEEVRKLRK